MRLVSDSPSRTREIGASLANILEAGDIVVLSGDLGAGKTCFVQGAASALGVSARVTSPTFILFRQYAGEVAVNHVDAYRMESIAELDDLDLDLEGCVTFIEWGDAISEALPEHLVVHIARSGDDERVITFDATSGAWESREIEATLR